MKCSFCGYEFEETEAKTGCQGCLMAGSCHMVKCPNCNYEMPTEPKLVKVIRAWRKKKNGTGRKSGRDSGKPLDYQRGD